MDRSFERAAQVLTGASVRFILGGGFAVNAHGYARGTEDIDLLVADADRETCRRSLAQAGFRSFRSTDVVDRYEPPPGARMVLDLLPIDDATFAILWAAAGERMVFGQSARVISFEHLLAMKMHAMKHDRLSRGLKDLLDIVSLARVKGWGPDSPELRDLALRHGSADLLESIKKAMSP